METKVLNPLSLKAWTQSHVIWIRSGAKMGWSTVVSTNKPSVSVAVTKS